MKIAWVHLHVVPVLLMLQSAFSARCCLAWRQRYSSRTAFQVFRKHKIGYSRPPASLTGKEKIYYSMNRNSLQTPPLLSMSNNDDDSSVDIMNIKATPSETTLNANVFDKDSPILHNLNPSQIQAVTQPIESITRVIAGPGSGKTRVLTSRIAYLLQANSSSHHNHNPCRILGVTFTRKAAGEMKRRLEILLQDQNSWQDEIGGRKVGNNKQQTGLERVTLGTFHSVCAKILRWHGEHLSTLPSVVNEMMGSFNQTNLDGSFTIVDDAAQLRILKECLEKKDIDLTKSNVRPQTILAAIGQIKSLNAQGTPFIPSESEKSIQKPLDYANKIFLLYREKLLASNCIDFDDLIFMTRELLMINDDIRERLQRRWTHVLVDEFQDTSWAQMSLIKLLTSSSLFVVGDADQSIYSWRGASVDSLSDFEQEFQHYPTAVQTVYLMENYRSTSNIVKAAQKIISSSSSKSKTGADQLRQDMKPTRGKGPSPRIVACSDDKSEANFVVDTIKESLNSKEYGVNHDVAIVYRTNAQSRALEEACVQNNLPYVIHGAATSFYKRQEVKDCLCYLQWLYNGRDRSSMLRAMTTPKRGIGDAAIAEFDKYCSSMNEAYENGNQESPKPTLLDFLLLLADSDDCATLDKHVTTAMGNMSNRTLRLIRVFARQMKMIRNYAYKSSLKSVLSMIVSEFELLNYFNKLSKSDAEYEERKANVEELEIATMRYETNGPCLQPLKLKIETEMDMVESPLGSFLDDISLVTEMAEQSADGRFAANLMTIHASKGMEFDTVFIIGNEDGLFPTARALKEGSTALEEEKRLCYVAMTRAKTELFMTWKQEAKVFFKEGIRTVDRERSQFLDILANASNKRSQVTNATRLKVSALSSEVEKLPSKTSSLKSGPSGTLQNKKESFVNSRQTNQARSFSDRPQSNKPQMKAFVKNNGPRKLSGPLKKLEGTTNVYNKQRKYQLYDVRQEVALTSAPRATTKQGDERVKQKVERKVNQIPMDSTWFYPIGSSVLHKSHGEGVVLPPPGNTNSGDMQVKVKFQSGKILIFESISCDLVPT